MVSLEVIRISFTMKFHIEGCNQFEACVDISCNMEAEASFGEVAIHIIGV